MDVSKLNYDELFDLKTNLEDSLDYYPEDSKKHDELYFLLEEVYAELKRYE